MKNKNPNKVSQELINTRNVFDASAGWSEELRRQNDNTPDEIFSSDILDALPDIFLIIDINGRLKRWNCALTKISGYSDSEILAMNITDFFISEDKQLILERLKRTQIREIARLEARLVTKTGKRIHYEFSGALLKNATDSLIFCWVGRNIDDRKRNEFNLLKAEYSDRILCRISQRLLNLDNFEDKISKSLEDLTNLLNANRAAIYEYSHCRRYFNNTFEWVKSNLRPLKNNLQNIDTSIFNGWLNKLNFKQYIIINELNELPPAAAVLKKELESLNIQSLIVAPLYIENEITGLISIEDTQKLRVWQNDEISTLTTFAEIISAVSETHKKTTEMKNRMMQIINSERLSSLGAMVTGIAHEINNPNSFIALNIPILEEYWNRLKSLLIEFTKNDSNFQIGNISMPELLEDMHRLIEAMKTGSDRIMKIVQDLKEFAADNTETKKDYYDIQEVIKKAYTICGAMVRRKTATITFNIQKDLPKIYGNFIKIEQVIINLLMNAAQTVNNTVTGHIKVECCQSGNDAIKLVISDNGCGMSSEILSRIFEPFFTTNRDKGGTGLGLSISDKIIKDEGSEILVSSDEGHGSVFIVHLPIKKKKLPKPQPIALIVDDEKILLELYEIILRKAGIKVITTNNSQEVANIIKSTKEIDIVITDVFMPNIDGFELICKIRRDYPWIKFICISGQDISDNLIKSLLDIGAKAFFRKSINPIDQIADKIKALRGERG